MKNKFLAITLSALFFVSLISSCAVVSAETSTPPIKEPQSTSTPVPSSEQAVNTNAANNPVQIVTLSESVSDSDTDTSWKDSDTQIILSGSSGTVTGQGATAEGSVITISEKGTYVFSGTMTDGQIIITATNSDKVHLVLNGVSITNKTGAAIYASQCDKLIITLADGTQNTLSDGGDNFVYANTEKEEPNATLFSKDDLTINGTGSLTVNAGFNNGIGTKDDLLIVSGNITVNALNHGLRGNDSVTILSGKFTIISGNDGINSNNTEDATLGNILIKDGDFTITSGDGYPGNSIKVNKKQMGGMNGGMGGGMRGGGFAGKNGGQAPNMPTSDAPVPAVTATASNELLQDETEITETKNSKAINASGTIQIDGGTFKISSYDDAIHSDIALTITDAIISLESGAMGMQAIDIVINSGAIDILNSYEGIEGENSLTINGGVITIKASDDGINISSTSGVFNMNGGDIVINAGTDGIDSNGNINQTGGKVTITVPNMIGGGDGPIDYDGTFTRNGGTMVDSSGNELSTEKLEMGGGHGGFGGRK